MRRKEADGQALSLNSVFGSAKATQEADNVLMVQIGKNVSTRARHPHPRPGRAQREADKRARACVCVGARAST